MNVYVAGRFEDAGAIRTVIAELVAMGHTITHDWTRFPSTDQCECARRDFDGVRDADFVFMVMDHPTHTYRGTCTELGIALGMHKRVLMVTDKSGSGAYAGNVFWHHAGIAKYDNVIAALSAVRLLGGIPVVPPGRLTVT